MKKFEKFKRTKTKAVTNYRIVLRKENGDLIDGQGWAKTVEESKVMFDSIRKKIKKLSSGELYFEDKLIKKI